MAVTDWRSWTSQSGGTMPPGVPPAAGTFPVVFPGVGPIPDLISGASSVPVYQDTPTTIKPVDPFYVGTVGTGGGWVAPMERYVVPSPFTTGTATVPAWPAGSPGASVPVGPIQRPAVAGLT